MSRRTSVWVLVALLLIITTFVTSTDAAAQTAFPVAADGLGANPCDGAVVATPISDESTPAAATPAPAESFDLAFIDMMIPHHRSAIAMAQVALLRAEHPEVRTLAQSIIVSQGLEIAQMQAWRDAWFPNVRIMPMDQIQRALGTNMSGMGSMMNPEMETQSLCNATGQFDEAFIQQMLPHHASAVNVSQIALTRAFHPEITAIAREIIEAQQREIAELQTWLSAWYGATPTTGQ